MELTALNHFYNDGRLASFCRDCALAKKKEIYERNKSPERARRWNLKANYGITPEDYSYLYEFQQFGCAICRMPFDKLHVDHNHKTGEVRGLLCVKCNVVLGHIENDEDLISKCIEYLKRTTWRKKAG